MVVGRRGIAAGHAISLRLRGCAVGGIDVIVVSVRQQASTPVFMEGVLAWISVSSVH